MLSQIIECTNAPWLLYPDVQHFCAQSHHLNHWQGIRLHSSQKRVLEAQ